jgi:hypothetical protein
MGVTRDTITLHIEELVLAGFPAGSRHAIGDALQRELTRLLREGGVGAQLAPSGTQGDLDGGTVLLPAPLQGPASGSNIARQVYAVLSQRGEKNG